MFGKVFPLAVSAVLLSAPFALAEAKAYLGIFGEDQSNGAQQKGAIVREVVPDSPAAKAGLKPGDVVFRVNDTDITSYEALAASIASRTPGERVTVNYWRDGAEQSASVTLAEAPADLATPRLPFDFGPNGFRFRIPGADEDFGFERPKDLDEQAEPAKPRPMIGVQLQPLDDALRQRLGVEGDGGVAITHVLPDSPAAKAGLKPTDVIVEVDGTKITDAKQLIELVGAKKAGDELKVGYVRDGDQHEATMTLAEMQPRLGGRFGMPPGIRRFYMPEEMQRILPRGMVQEMGQRNAELERKVEELERQVEELTRQIDKLKETKGVGSR